MLSYENSLIFEKDQTPAAQLLNFWDLENGFVWSAGKWCELAFPFDLGPRQQNFENSDLIFDMDVFRIDDRLPGQNLFIYLNGLRVGSFFCAKRSIFVCQFDTKHLKRASNIITVDTPESASPRDFGSADTRSLGLQLFSLQIRKSG